MKVAHFETPTHGRVLIDERDAGLILLGFHGYGEKAEATFPQLRKIPGIDDWTVAAVQALHPFYTRSGEVVASWMTKEDRELAIADNLEYIRRVIASFPAPRCLVFLGFSQGASMAARAAAYASKRADGLILLGGDIPPEVASDPEVRLPATLLARGRHDRSYDEEKFNKDSRFLEGHTRVETLVFDGGHEWTDEFRERAGEFLRSLPR